MFFVNTLYLNISKIKSKTFKLNEKQMSFFNDCLKNICEETNLLMLDNFIQHGNTTCLWHSIAVAYYAYCFSQFFNIKCDEKALYMVRCFMITSYMIGIFMTNPIGFMDSSIPKQHLTML